MWNQSPKRDIYQPLLIYVSLVCTSVCSLCFFPETSQASRRRLRCAWLKLEHAIKCGMAWEGRWGCLVLFDDHWWFNFFFNSELIPRCFAQSHMLIVVPWLSPFQPLCPVLSGDGGNWKLWGTGSDSVTGYSHGHGDEFSLVISMGLYIL